MLIFSAFIGCFPFEGFYCYAESKQTFISDVCALGTLDFLWSISSFLWLILRYSYTIIKCLHTVFIDFIDGFGLC